MNDYLICSGCGAEPPQECSSECPRSREKSTKPLRELREAKGYSVEELARRMSMADYVVLDLEHDATYHGFEALHAYLNALDLQLELSGVDASGKRTVLR